MTTSCPASFLARLGGGALLRLGCTLAALPGLVLAGPIAVAAPRADPGKALADEAAALFKAKDYLRAAELFERSFALSPDKLVRLRNAGRAYEEAGKLDNARLVFERYLALAPPSAERDEVAERLARIQVALIEQRRKELAEASDGAPESAAKAAGAAGPGAPARDAPTSSPEKAESAKAPDPARTVRTGKLNTPKLPWALIGTGAVLTGLGIGWQLNAVLAQDELNAQSRAGLYDGPGGRAAFDTQQGEIRTAEQAAWTMIGLGTAAALAGGIWLWRERRTEPSVTLWPTVGSGTAGAVLQGQF